MVEIGRVRVKTGNAPIEQKISAYAPQADICAFVSTSLETKRAARRPSQDSMRVKRMFDAAYFADTSNAAALG